MTTLNRSLGKIYGFACCLLLGATSAGLASDVVLQKAPFAAPRPPTKQGQSRLGPQATFALVNYNLRDVHANARALYVSSGNDLTLAANMVDDQVATSFGFAADDKSPTVLIDLGKLCTVRQLSAAYSARPGSIDFYVMQSLPGSNDGESTDTMTLDSNALASLKPIGSIIDDGSQGRASIEFPATSGRYLMLRWIPAAHDDASFTMAEVTAMSASGGPLLAASGRYFNNQPASERTVSTDAKDVPDSKDVYESKDIPAEAPPGLPPALPEVPPFTFIPVVTEPIVVPPAPPVINPHSL